MTFKARYKTGSDTKYQSLTEHLQEVGMYVELFARKISLPKPAILTALVHDLGKNCQIWQEYLDESHKTGRKNKKEDHATAGGQYLYDAIKQKFDDSGELIAQLLAACIIYHHGSGLPDIIKPDGTARLSKRLEKGNDETHVEESVANFDISIKQELEAIFDDVNFIADSVGTLKIIGAWIETVDEVIMSPEVWVAPRTGAWIETVCERETDQNKPGRTPHGCVD